MVSTRVVTAAPVEALPRALLMSAFCCWLRTRSAATSAAVDAVVFAITVVPATAPVACVPLIEPPAPPLGAGARAPAPRRPPPAPRPAAAPSAARPPCPPALRPPPPPPRSLVDRFDVRQHGRRSEGLNARLHPRGRKGVIIFFF